MGFNEQLRKRERTDKKMRRSLYISEILSWIPELLFLPIRILIWLFKGIVWLIAIIFQR
ncbi:hypothetical protein [Paraliobacillus sediminis]|uniref:hypothetical protein n=1 Tax=Paraliobacillus sediminis TaxID=1885916 RepID=UPI0013C36333|nr:hypothetical protein [Paraliobacillus sediminis]